MKVTVTRIAGAVAYLCALCWVSAFAYADWLRFSSPKAPDAETGQIVLEKAVKGVFYITPAQAFWVQTMLPFVWGTMAAAFAVVFVVNRRVLFKWQNRSRPDATGLRSMLLHPAVQVIWVCAMASLFFFGDQVMQLIFAGTVAVPPEPR